MFMDALHDNRLEHATLPEPRGLAVSSATPATLQSTQPTRLMHGFLALLAVLLVVQVVPQLASLAADRWSSLFSGIDPDGAFAWMWIHHSTQLVLALAIMAAWRRGALPRWGFNLLEWRTSMQWFGWFALYCTLGVVLFGVLPHLLRGTAPQFDFALSPRNIAGRLSFYYLLSGTGEEPLFRAFVMGVLLLSWRREFRLGRLVLPAAGLWATLIFMLAHVGYTLGPPTITNFSWPQQAFCLGLGLYYAAALYRTRSLLCPILAHGFSNGIIFTLMYALALWTAPPPRVLPESFETGSAGDMRLATALENVRAMNQLPALAAVSVTADGRVIDIAVAGVRRFGHPQQVTTLDQWHLGSITKPMTATLAARLVEQGRIGWETKVTHVFPSIAPNIRPEYLDVTLSELLSHTSGLPMGISQELFDRLPEIDALAFGAEQRQRLAALILSSAPAGPRGEYVYSNTGYILVGKMLEEVTGTPWETLMRQEVFEPLGMTGAGIGAPGIPGQVDQPWGHVAATHLMSKWRAIEPVKNADIEDFWTPCGRIHATLEDIAKFAAAHLAGERGRPGLVSVETFRRLHAPVGDGQGAMDWGTVDQPWAWGRTLTHSGRTPPWYATLVLAPQRGVAIFAATNAGEGSAEQGVDQALQILIRRLEAAEPPRYRLEPDPPVGGQDLVITYLASLGPLADSKEMTLHYGFDRWDRTNDALMSKSGDGDWMVPISIPPDANQIDFVFTDGNKWDNNSGSDWHVSIKQR